MKRRTNAINRPKLEGPLDNMDEARKRSWEACVKVAETDDDIRFIVESSRATQAAVDKYNRGELTRADALKAISALKTGMAVADDVLKEEGLL